MSDFSVVIVGGGVHGAGLLHDLTTRRVPGVVLCETYELAHGTSSRSTKLIHGGLRYLERLEQWPLVWEALRERTLLSKILPDLVKPLPFILPNTNQTRPPWFVRCGLGLYDFMAGDSGLPPTQMVQKQHIGSLAPYLNNDYINKNIKSAFLFYDAQTIDDALVRASAYAAQKLGGRVWEHTQVQNIRARAQGDYEVTLQTAQGTQTITAKCVVNAAAAHANANLLQWGIRPQIATLLNVGSHIVFPKKTVAATPEGTSYGCLLQNTDGRILFFIPWEESWLYGTTESIYAHTDPAAVETPQHDLAYLEKAAQGILDIPSPLSQMQETFAGIRTMPLRDLPPACRGPWQDTWATTPYGSPFYVKNHDGAISRLSRETRITQDRPGLFSLYGGKYTTYRYQSVKLGRMVCNYLDMGGVSQTHTHSAWFLKDLLDEHPTLFKSRAHLRHSPAALHTTENAKAS